MEKYTNNKETVKRRGILKYLGSIGLMAGIGGSSAMATSKVNNLSVSQTINILVDFADSDHREMVVKNAASFQGMNAELLMRSYYFIDSGQKIKSTFSKVHNRKDRGKVLAKSRLVVTPCLVTALEAKVKGCKVIYAYDELTSRNEKTKAEGIGLTTVDITQKSKVTKTIKKMLV